MGEKIALCNAHYLHYPLERFLHSVKENGKRRIALYGSVPHLLIDHYDYQEAVSLSKMLKHQDIMVDALVPASYGYSLFAERGTEHFKVSAEYYGNCIRAAKCLGTDVVCIRPQNGILSQEYEHLIANAAELLETILPIAREENVRIALGTNLLKETAALHRMEEIKMLISKVNDSYLGVLLDTHVMSMVDETIEDWMNSFGNSLFYVHIADGRKQGYRVWGKGVYPITDYIRELAAGNYCGGVACFLMGNHGIPERVDRIHFQTIAAMEMEGVWRD